MKNKIFLFFCIIITCFVHNTYACCDNNADYILTSTSISEAVNNGVIPPNEANGRALPNGNCFYISGPLSINENYTFSSIDFKLNYNAEIVIAPGVTLTILSSSLEGCNYLWKRILINENAKLIIKNSKVLDAFTAIRQLKNSTLSAENVIFDNNYVGIGIGDGTELSAQPLNNFYVEGCEFTNTTQTLKPTDPSTPSPSSFSHTGIYVLAISNINIGYPVSDNFNPVKPVNFFDGLLFGIRSFRSNISVHGCQFKNTGTGIYLQQTYNENIPFASNGSLIQTGLGASPPNTPNQTNVTPTFQNVSIGISLQEVDNAQIENNLMQNVGLGISYLQQNPFINSNIFVSKNNIIGANSGIFLSNNNNNFNELSIENNYIELEYQNTINTSRAIFVSEGLLSPVNPLFIKHNEIRVFDDWTRAITIRNISNTNILNNNIALLNTPSQNTFPSGNCFKVS